MKRIILSLAVFLFAAAAWGQVGIPPGVVFGNPTPGGACSAGAGQIVSSTGTIYTCVSSVWTSTGTASFPGCTSDGSNGFQCTGSVAAGAAVTGPNLNRATFGYTFYLSGGIYYARNNQTTLIDYSGSDAGPVIRSAIANNATTCGHLYFQPAVYNVNTLVQESTGGYSNYYAIGLPPSAATNQKCQWFLEGDSSTPLIDQFGTPAQTGGVILYVTPAAIATVSATTKVTGIWARPDVANTVGATVFLQNLNLRFPTNQRGCETASDVSLALMANYYNVTQDTAVSQNLLQYPVQASCTAWGATDPGGLIGMTTTNSSKESNNMYWVFASGADIGLDVRSEHTVLYSSGAVNSNHCIDYGFRGGNVYHLSAWINPECGEVSRALTLGPNLQSGTLLDISGLDMEDAQIGIWVPVYHALETTSGNSFGRISYVRVTQNVGISPLASLFDGGGGAKFHTLSSVSETLPNLPTSATTQSPGDATTAIATDAFVTLASNNASGLGAFPIVSPTPSFSPVAGVISPSTSVTASCTGGATCYASVDGTTIAPSCVNTISPTTTVYAECVLTGARPSSNSAIYISTSWVLANASHGQSSSSPTTSQALAAFSSNLGNPSNIAVCVGQGTGGNPTFSVTDTAGNSYAGLGMSNVRVNSQSVMNCFCAQNTHTTAANVITVHSTISGGFLGGAAAEIQGTRSSCTLDGGAGVGYQVQASGTGGAAGSNNLTMPSMTTVTAGDFILANFFTINVAATVGTSPNAFTGVQSPMYDAEYFIQAGAGAIAVTASDSFTADPYGAIALAFKP